MKTILITGANRGIGLGLTDRFLQSGNKVIAAVRNPDGARDLWELESTYDGRLEILPYDAGDEKSIKAMAEKIPAGTAIDVLINNAGILLEPSKGLEEMDPRAVERSFHINVMGPIHTTRALLPFLKKAKHPVVANMSSLMGSVSDNKAGGYYAYRISKAALNMFNKSFAMDYPNITSVVLHPGWVQTDMGGPNATTPIPEACAGLVKVIENLKPKDTGKFFDFKGHEKPW